MGRESKTYNAFFVSDVCLQSKARTNRVRPLGSGLFFFFFSRFAGF